MNFTMEPENINVIADIIKICFINICTYYIALKLTNKSIYTNLRKILIVGVSLIIISIISKIIKEIFGFLYNVISISLLVSFVFSKARKDTYAYSLIITVISLSINYIFLLIGILIGFIASVSIRITNEYMNLTIIILIYIMFVYHFCKIKRFNKGWIFLQKKISNEYLEVFILNISVIILFCITILSNYNVISSNSFGAGLVITAIIMFMTIQKSLHLYYKQNMLVKDLNETKEELEKKKHEIEELEKENLNFSKTSHSIAHKQKALEYKLNELMLKNEMASETDIRKRLNKISKEAFKVTTVELSKTNIVEIDDMLKYMQSECIKSKIDFQLQITGNIHRMINNYISKEDLEILIADHIKNAIVAINHSDSSNKSILVRLGMIDGFYSLYVYDSGVEFEIETLSNLGKRPSTTHSDEGGTGIGFMNTFDTLKKCKASMIINEYGKPSRDNYTKVIMIKFDKKDEFKISSYRLKDIKIENN